MKWYVKEFSELTKVSVRTLHHYDKIGLLKPALRLPSGYRVYSEADLVKLQQITSLKFLGFQLSKIKALFSEEKDVRGLFRMQQQLVEKKLIHLEQAHKVLMEIVSICDTQELVDLKAILKLVEVYRMTHEFKKSWVSKVFTHEQLKKFAAMDPRNIPAEMVEQYGRDWETLVGAFREHLAENPADSPPNFLSNDD